jgi:hypothetical protein
MYWLCQDESGTWVENSRRRPHFAIECLSSVVESHDDMDTMVDEMDILALAGQALYVQDEQVFAREVW